VNGIQFVLWLNKKGENRLQKDLEKKTKFVSGKWVMGGSWVGVTALGKEKES